jgi:hypothetical protein
MIWFLFHTLSPSAVSKLSLVELTDGIGGEGGGGGAKSYFGEKTWSSINYTILSGRNPAQEI